MTFQNERRYQLAPNLQISRILNGMWQVAGGHGYIDPTSAINSMIDYHNAGFTTWDLADIYGPAEDFVGDFRHKLRQVQGESALDNVQALTKFVPNSGTMTRHVVEQNIKSTQTSDPQAPNPPGILLRSASPKTHSINALDYL